MNIEFFLGILKQDPRSFHIIGKGGRCLALAHRKFPKFVLLLEKAKDSVSTVQEVNIRPDRAHARATTFARMYDQHLEKGLNGIRNWRRRPYIHSTTLGGVSPENFDGPIPLHIGEGQIFMAYSARLVKRIPGHSLHYLDFADTQNALSPQQVDHIANDLAQWLYTLHHEVSNGAMAANKVEKQFADTGRSILDSGTHSEKYRLFVTLNLQEIRTLLQKLEDDQNASSGKVEMIANLKAAGVDFHLLAQLAECIEKRLPQILPNDRFGLTHSDIHPANIIVNSRMDCVHGICDWMTGTITAQSTDFAGFGLAKGLLPKIVKNYRRLERERRPDRLVNVEAIYAFATMRQIFVAVKSAKHGYAEGIALQVAWSQVRELVGYLAQTKTEIYGEIARKIRRRSEPVLHVPSHRPSLASRPSPVI